MHLSSILEPDGPRSSGHYLVVRYESRSELIKLPETYSELQKQVGMLFNLKPNQYQIETKHLNMCVGERIRIPEEFWGDIAKVLGNVDVVLRAGRDGGAFDRNPEGGPEPLSQLQLVSSPPFESHAQAHAPTATNHGTQAGTGILKLEPPVISDEFIVLGLGELDPMIVFFPTTCTFSIQVLDAEGRPALTISIASQTGQVTFSSALETNTVTFPLNVAFPGIGLFGRLGRLRFSDDPDPDHGYSSDHIIVIRRLRTKFEIRFDLRVVAYVATHPARYEAESESRPPLTSVAYDSSGSTPPFQGSISASVYSGLASFDAGGLGRRARIHRPTLFCQISECTGTLEDARFVKGALDYVRLRGSGSEDTGGIKWTSQPLYDNLCTDVGWTFSSHTLHLFRFYLSQTVPTIYISFGTASTSYPLTLTLTPSSSTVQFGETLRGQNGVVSKHGYYHAFNLNPTFFETGEHSIGIVGLGGRNSGKVQVIFDFCQSTILLRDTLVACKPKEVSVKNIRGGVTAESYDFAT